MSDTEKPSQKPRQNPWVKLGIEMGPLILRRSVVHHDDPLAALITVSPLEALSLQRAHRRGAELARVEVHEDGGDIDHEGKLQPHASWISRNSSRSTSAAARRATA